MSRLEIENLRCAYGTVDVLPDLSLSVERGECVALLGPSGCGKSTTLRAVAGFVQPRSGRIRIGGRDVTGSPPHRRNVGLVFQDYALFPHMSVAENVAYGLVRRGVPKAELGRRVEAALALVRLSTFGARSPAALSGGQRQRVALARAIVVEPDVLLLDEPLGALDRLLRDEMQFELKTLQGRLGLTCIIVTHDQEEALSLAHRVALMFDGHVAEIAAPADLYRRPSSVRAMTFLGASSILDARAGPRAGGDARYRVAGGEDVVATARDVPEGTPVRLGIRPERIALSPGEPAGPNRLGGTVTQIVYKGPSADVYLDHHGTPLRAQLAAETLARDAAIAPGAFVWARFDPADVLVFPGADQQR